jgi:small subunit ribosomal protein S9
LAVDQGVRSVGRRKEAVARVQMVAGEGRVIVNERELRAYFGRSILEQEVLAPLKHVDSLTKYDINIRILGGGVSGQAGAAVQGIARALIAADPDLRPALKAAGFLTRDARVKERKKPGLKKARKAPQYTKR